MADGNLVSINDIPCCPEIERTPCCERLRISYRLTSRQSDVPVEITIVAELERCPGPMSLGDVVFSTTLLPGEKIRLFTSTRNTRFTYDAESKVTQPVGHEIHRPGHIWRVRDGQRIRFVPLQPLPGLDPQVQRQLAVDPINPFVVPAVPFDVAQMQKA